MDMFLNGVWFVDREVINTVLHRITQSAEPYPTVEILTIFGSNNMEIRVIYHNLLM